MTDATESGVPDPMETDEASLRDLIGYLNFSGGAVDARFQRDLNLLHARLPGKSVWQRVRQVLDGELTRLNQESAAFADIDQASHIIRLVFDHLWPAYRRHHADLLFHLKDEDMQQPFFLARLFEAALSQGPPWDETDRIVDGALRRLNDFIGHRPVAVLENDQKMEPYDHERFRPIPLYIKGAGVAAGRYEALISRAIQLFEDMPADLLIAAHFDVSRIEELAVDVRAYDHLHPANKRTNYIFGEWDPHTINTKGYYCRFVVRQIILDSLVDWMSDHRRNRDEALYDAAAVLCGTMLMASAISGAGPETHDSNVTLSSQLPIVARQRDAFYARLLDNATGARAKRLVRHARKTRQPFGHVRQKLNLHLAGYGARQIEFRHLALLYARMGQTAAAREQAAAIPSLSTRFECEIQWRITAIHRKLDQSDVAQANELITECESYIHRGIKCGALVDPWNILGFQGQYPLFSAREDSIPDQRIETLLDLMERFFGVCSRTLNEAAVQGETDIASDVSRRFRNMAEYWEQFASHTVSDLPVVKGVESWESATHVSQALSEWRAAGESAGDITFWRTHVGRFQSAKSYAQVVEILLDHGDCVAAMGLLMQWLSQTDHVAMEAGPYSIHALLLRWMKAVTESDDSTDTPRCNWNAIRRLFDYLEANAGEYWSVPVLADVTGKERPPSRDGSTDELMGGPPRELFEDPGSIDSDDFLYRAAYDGVTFNDSAWDGEQGEVLDGSYGNDDSEFDHICRYVEPRLRFLMTLSLLWQNAGVALAAEPERSGDEASAADDSEAEEQARVILQWRNRLSELQNDLAMLQQDLWDHDIAPPSGDHDSNVEYDLHLQTKFYLVNNIITTSLSCRTAERCLLCCLPPDIFDRESPRDDRKMLRVQRGVMRGDVETVRRGLPALLRSFSGKPVLYVPLDEDGPPNAIAEARRVQADVRFLLSHLPRLGLLRETWHVLRTAHRMEKVFRPSGTVVSEFDRLFRTALRHSLECVTHSFDETVASDGPLQDEDSASLLVQLIHDIVDHYFDLWLKHSRTMRLSTVEALDDEEFWEEIKTFIQNYGADLFHAKMLTLGNVRAILHNGIDWFLQYLSETEDPLHPIRLLSDLDDGVVDFDDVVDMLEVIYGSVVDKFDRFLEYNTTTTQSDYGEMFHHLLDFLRVEASYDRDAWNYLPYRIAHTVLANSKQDRGTRMWEQMVEMRTRDIADTHLASLKSLERLTGICLPIVSDRLNERFIRPMDVNRMMALVPQAIQQASQNGGTSPAFELLREEINDYLKHTSGSGVDVAEWLQTIEREVNRFDPAAPPTFHLGEFITKLPQTTLTTDEMAAQLKSWNQPVASTSQPKKATRKTPPSKS